jgi:hypothetical protein
MENQPYTLEMEIKAARDLNMLLREEVFMGGCWG